MSTNPHQWLDVIFLPCGADAFFDHDLVIDYRCQQCNAVVGSVGQPQSCQDANNKWKTLEALGGKGWNYRRGEPHK